MSEVLALIPARSGSKEIAHKNIANIAGKPMLAHSIDHAVEATRVDRVIVSTDSELYAEIARQYGAEVPFLRPSEFAGDHSTDLQVFEHASRWLQNKEEYSPRVWVHLRPTYPLRDPRDIDRAVDLLESDPSFDSVRSVIEAPDTPFKMWWLGEEGLLDPVVSSELVEPYNEPRQVLPRAYLQNGCIDVVWGRVLREQRSMTGDRIRGMLMEHHYDVDSLGHLGLAQTAALPELAGKRLVVDIDGVIATLTPDNEYSLAEPIRSTIDLLNRLYDAGAVVILFTARGTMTGIDQEELTRGQLARWGVRYHQLIFGKPAGDFYLDDRMVTLTQLERIVERLPSEK